MFMNKTNTDARFCTHLPVYINKSYTMYAVYFLVIIVGTVVKTQLLDLGENCTLPGEYGQCVPLFTCTSAAELFKRGIRREPCGFLQSIPLVCCPYVSRRDGSKSNEKCVEYLNTPAYGTGVGGSLALMSEFPHIVALGFGNKNDSQWLCGGTLISDRFVLTAAHCLSSPEWGSVRWARAGTTNLKEPEKGGLFPADYEVINHFVHPDYKPPSRYNDIALLQLDRDISYNQGVYPACMNTKPIAAHTYVQAIGWGATEVGGSGSNDLIKVDLEVYTADACKNRYSNTPRIFLERGIDNDFQICAGGAKNQSRDTCQGDSGGPLHEQILKGYFNVYNVIGVTSFGKGCGFINVPGVYTRITKYIPWIESIVWPD